MEIYKIIGMLSVCVAFGTNSIEAARSSSVVRKNDRNVQTRAGGSTVTQSQGSSAARTAARSMDVRGQRQEEDEILNAAIAASIMETSAASSSIDGTAACSMNVRDRRKKVSFNLRDRHQEESFNDLSLNGSGSASVSINHEQLVAQLMAEQDHLRYELAEVREQMRQGQSEQARAQTEQFGMIAEENRQLWHVYRQLNLEFRGVQDRIAQLERVEQARQEDMAQQLAQDQEAQASGSAATSQSSHVSNCLTSTDREIIDRIESLQL